LPPDVDPYAEPPSFFRDHADLVWAVIVGACTVLLTVLIFPPYNVPEFACAFAVPAVFWAYTRPSFKLFAWTLFAAQAIAWTILLGWLHHVTWPGLFLLGPFIGAWVGLWYLAAWWTMPRMVGRPTYLRLAAMIGLAGMWVLLEWSRTWMLSGFPWLPLALSQWQRTAMLQVAAYTGATGVSFVLVMVNLGFAAYAHRLFREGATGLGKRSQEFFLALFLVLACFSLHVQETFNRGRFMVPFARVGFMQPYIPQEVKWDPARAPAILDIIQQTTLAAAKVKPDLILWPEAVLPMAVKGDPNAKGWTEDLIRRAGSPTLLGSIGSEVKADGEHWYNGVFAVDPQEGLQPGYYAKRHLVPFGEYVPLHFLFGWLRKFVEIGGDFEPGEAANPLVVHVRNDNYAFGPLLCYEDIYPELARRSALAGAEVLTVLTNNAWFGEGGAAYQHAAHSILRAVETRRPVLRCGNGGWSGWIDEFGNVRAVLTKLPNGSIQTITGGEEGTIYFRGAATVQVSRDSRWVGQNSFYVEHGDWFILVCAGFAGVAFAMLRGLKPTPIYVARE
jgi:apolipoprotein N-acyltransferase